MREIYKDWQLKSNKIKNKLSPSFMNDIFPQSTNSINLRHRPIFERSNVKSVYNGTETLSFRGPQLWSIIPDNIKHAENPT